MGEITDEKAIEIFGEIDKAKVAFIETLIGAAKEYEMNPADVLDMGIGYLGAAVLFEDYDLTGGNADEYVGSAV